MNWNLIKRSHLNSRPAPTSGLCTIAEEADIDYAFLRLQKLEETNRAVQRDCKHLKECLMNLARAEEKLSQDLSQSNLVHSDEDFCSMVEEYHSVTKQMGDSAKVCTDLLQLTIYNPLKKYGAEFASAQAAIKKRDQLITDLLPFRGKLEKLRERERTGSNIARTEQLKRQLSTLESDFKTTNRQLLEDMNHMLDLRADYMEPSILAFIRCKTEYYGECTKLFNCLLRQHHASRSSVTEPNSSQLTAQFDHDMQAIRALSIVSDK